MAYSRDPSRYHIVTLDTKNVKVLSQPRPDDQLPSSIFGPFGLLTYVCIPRHGGPNGDGKAVPGRNFVRLFLTTLPLIRTPWTITAAVTEIQPPSTPWRGEARFDTLGVNLYQSGEYAPHANVWFYLDWHWPLPFGVMATIGFT